VTAARLAAVFVFGDARGRSVWATVWKGCPVPFVAANGTGLYRCPTDCPQERSSAHPFEMKRVRYPEKRFGGEWFAPRVLTTMDQPAPHAT
jgi:hypothetical protein